MGVKQWEDELFEVLINMMFRLFSENKYSIENAAKELELSVEKFCEKMKKAGYKVPAMV